MRLGGRQRSGSPTAQWTGRDLLQPLQVTDLALAPMLARGPCGWPGEPQKLRCGPRKGEWPQMHNRTASGRLHRHSVALQSKGLDVLYPELSSLPPPGNRAYPGAGEGYGRLDRAGRRDGDAPSPGSGIHGSASTQDVVHLGRTPTSSGVSHAIEAICNRPDDVSSPLRWCRRRRAASGVCGSSSWSSNVTARCRCLSSQVPFGSSWGFDDDGARLLNAVVLVAVVPVALHHQTRHGGDNRDDEAAENPEGRAASLTLYPISTWCPPGRPTAMNPRSSRFRSRQRSHRCP